jgi:hypothetical protein
MQVRHVIWLVQAGLLCLPALLVLGNPQTVLGMPGGEIYPRLHALFAAQHELVLGFPGMLPPQAPEFPASLLPFAPAVSIRVVQSLDMLLTLWIALLFTRGLDGWSRAAAAGAFAASPAVISMLTSGEPEALRGWALLGPALGGGVGLGCAVVGALLAPGFAVLSPVLLVLAEEKSLKKLVPSMLACGLSLWQGLPDHPAPVPAWFGRYQPPPDASEWPAIYIGFSTAALIVTGLLLPGPQRRVAGLGVAVFVLGAIRTPLNPACVLALLPLLALMTVGQLKERFKKWFPAIPVLTGVLVVGEGFKGSSWPVPTASLDVPELLSDIPGPVFDLPATRAACRRSLYQQTLHQKPIACGPDGFLAEEVRQAITQSCPNVQAVGFRSLVVRREAEYRNLEKLVSCLGSPTKDDGKTAIWIFSPDPPHPSPPSLPPLPGNTPTSGG